MSDWRPVDLPAWPREPIGIHPIGHLIELITAFTDPAPMIDAWTGEFQPAASSGTIEQRNEMEEKTVRVVVGEFISLDGVVQAPGGPDEDTSGGFRHGGWSMKYFDPEIMGAVIDEFAERSDALLQGRRTYQVSAAAWPERSGKLADWINGTQKYVVSDTLTEAGVTSWTPTTIIRSADLLKEVSTLRDQPGGDIYVYGSLSVARTLLTAGLVDELVLMIEPITLGGGKTSFPNDGETREFELTSAKTASTGVQVCRYQRAS